MSRKEDESKKEPCPVCGKLISPSMGRTVHNNSKFHQDALKRQQEGGKEEPEPPETKEKPADKPPEVKPPGKKEPAGNVNSGIAGKGKGKGESSKEDGTVEKFLGWLFKDD